MDCRNCKTRPSCRQAHRSSDHSVNAGATDRGLMKGLYIVEHEITCPSCGSKDFTDIRYFNLMFKTFQGVTEDSTSTIYLRPETAQGMFVNFKGIFKGPTA